MASKRPSTSKESDFDFQSKKVEEVQVDVDETCEVVQVDEFMESFPESDDDQYCQLQSIVEQDEATSVTYRYIYACDFIDFSRT